MPTSPSFDESLDRVTAAHATKTTDVARWQRAWSDFYTRHLVQVMHEGKLYANAIRLGWAVDDITVEIAMAILDRIERGLEVNRKVVYGIRNKLLQRINEKANRLDDEDFRRRFSSRLVDLAESETADVAGMRLALEQLIAELEQEPRSELKVQVLRAMLRDPDWSFVGIAKELGRSDGGIKSTFAYLSERIRTTHPELAEYLGLPDTIDLREVIGVEYTGSPS
jgi:hypothetical protein